MAWLTFTGVDPPLHVPLYQDGSIYLDSLARALARHSPASVPADMADGGYFGSGCALWATRDGFALIQEGGPAPRGPNEIAVNGQPVGRNSVSLCHGDTLTLLGVDATLHDPPAGDVPLPPEAAGLWRDVLDNPADAAPRLVLADWLDERGEAGQAARAEFIRLQCDLAREPALWEGEPRCLREGELQRGHEVAWAGPVLPGLVNAWEYRRGFVEVVTVDAAALGDSDNLRTLFRSAPVREVVLEGAGWEHRNLDEGLFLVGRLEGIAGAPPGRGDPEAFLDLLRRCEVLPDLRRLTLRQPAGDDSPFTGLDHIEAPELTELHLLDVVSVERFLSGVLAMPMFQRLTTLAIEGIFPPVGDLTPLVEAPCLPHLVDLELAACYDLAPQTLLRLLDALPPGRLRRLCLDCSALSLATLRQAIESPALQDLTDLSLVAVVGVEGFGDDLLQVIATTPHLVKLVRLDLRHNGLTDAGARTLLASGRLPALRLLRLDNNSFSPECRAELMRFRAGVQVCV
jgi:uncharacterized protein (TIGR02996 family)